MFKSLMGRSGVKEISECQLVNVPETLKCPRVHNTSFVGISANENVNWISEFVNVLCHSLHACLENTEQSGLTRLSPDAKHNPNM